MKISIDRVSEILKNAASAKVAVLGDLMLDVYVSGSASRISQEAPVPVLLVKKQEARPGGAANVMRNLTSLGAGTVMAFGVVGRDADGEKLCALLESGHVKTNGITGVSRRRTTVKQRVIAANQQVVRMDFEDTEPVSEEVRSEIVSRICRKIERHEMDALILEDYAKGLMEFDMLQQIADCAAKHGVYTSLDPHAGHNMGVTGLSLITPNRMEAFDLAGLPETDPAAKVEKDEPLKQVAKAVIRQWKPESLLITLSAQGMALFKKSKPGAVFAIPTVAREVFDVSGAGDTVIATYTLCMAAGATEEEAATIANHAAGIVVGKAGTAVTTPEELLASFR